MLGLLVVRRNCIEIKIPLVFRLSQHKFFVFKIALKTGSCLEPLKPDLVISQKELK